MILLFRSQQDALIDAAVSIVGPMGALLAELDLSNLGVRDRGAAEVAACISRGATPCLQALDLSANGLTDSGIVSLLNAVAAAGPPKLRLLDLSSNEACDEGAAALAKLIRTRAAADTVTANGAGGAGQAEAGPDAPATEDEENSVELPLPVTMTYPGLFGRFHKNLPLIQQQGTGPVGSTIERQPPLPHLHIRLSNNHYPFSLDVLEELQAALQLSRASSIAPPTHRFHSSLKPSSGSVLPPPPAAVTLEMVRSHHVATGGVAPRPDEVANGAVALTASMHPPSLQERLAGRLSHPGLGALDWLVPNAFRLAPLPTPAKQQAGHKRSTSHATDCSDPDGCGVCMSAPNSLTIRECGHKLCVQCYRRLVKPEIKNAVTCPFCRGPINGFEYTGWPARLW